LLKQVAKQLPELAVDASNGLRYYVRPGDDVIGKSIIHLGAFQPERIAAVLNLLTARRIKIRQLVDIGANIGTTTLELLRQRPGVTAVAFEPDPSNFSLLKLNVIANGMGRRVRTERLALGDVTGQLELELADSNYGDHRVRVSTATPDAFGERDRKVIRVPGARLDDVEGLTIGPDTLLYIDTQGFEGHVLAGAPVALSRRPPIAFELWPYGLDRAGGRERLFAAVASYGELYDVEHWPPRRMAHGDLDQLCAELGRGPTGHTDVLALP